jgi:hypothetical protein
MSMALVTSVRELSPDRIDSAARSGSREIVLTVR